MKKNTEYAPIVRSLLETDFYKFTMQQVMLHKYPENEAVYEFRCRNTPQYPLAELEEDINRELDHLCTLRFQPDELAWLATKSYLKKDYINFLRVFQFDRQAIQVKRNGDTLDIRAPGPQVYIMGYEIYVLYIVSELYMRRLNPEAAMKVAIERTEQKIKLLKEFGQRPAKKHPFEFFDFGLRRRHSAAVQDKVVDMLRAEVPEYFKGTSNCYLAMKHGLTAIGTVAHEHLMTYQQVGIQLRSFQKAAMEDWASEYRGELGTALTDVVGIDAFLADFDKYFGLLFDGARHDSGDPFVWGEKMLAKYAQLRIDANSKRLVFSDGLDFPKSFALYEHFADRAMNGFGVGTHLTNDCGITPLNLVMKLVEVNGQPVAKLSDSPGKLMCKNETFVNYLRQVFNKYD